VFTRGGEAPLNPRNGRRFFRNSNFECDKKRSEKKNLIPPCLKKKKALFGKKRAQKICGRKRNKNQRQRKLGTGLE